MLELKNISKQFGQHKIFDKYNLTVEEGKILAIVGPSGGGKTTLLRMLAGLETIDSGQIIYENEEIPLDQMESRNLLGFVFQYFQLYEGKRPKRSAGDAPSDRSLQSGVESPGPGRNLRPSSGNSGPGYDERRFRGNRLRAKAKPGCASSCLLYTSPSPRD